MKERIRSPIVVVLGHVDHGKTTLLDSIRGTSIAMKEAGGITQHIGATEIPISVIEKISKEFVEKFGFKFKIPGLLFIDTPGHEVFTNLRRRGGSIADFAIIVIDITEGFKPQTYEAIDICKTYKVPFIIAANKIDKISGWIVEEGKSFLNNLKIQKEEVKNALDNLIYNLIGELYNLGFEAERFDRVIDFTKQVAIVPISAKYKIGLQELLALISGISQKFLEKRLRINIEGPGKGVIIEKKEIKGMGYALDVILYDGILRRGDTFLAIGEGGIIESKIKGIFKPRPLTEIREKKGGLKEIKEVCAAAGIRIISTNSEKIYSGSPLYVFHNQKEKTEIYNKLKKEMKEIIFEKDTEGLVVKADTLGSLEAIIKMLKDKNIKIAIAGIGSVSKKDIIFANSVKEKDVFLGCVICFNVEIPKEILELANKLNVKIISDNVIYSLIEKIEKWREEAENIKKREIFKDLIYPFKIRILKGFIFRRSNPAIVGIEVIGGKVYPNTLVMNENGKVIGKIKSIQKEGKSIEYASSKDKVAISIEKGVVGRNIFEDQILYSYIPEEHFKKYKENKELLTEEEKKLLKEIAGIMRKINPTWGL